MAQEFWPPARARRISKEICNERATPPAAKRTRQNQTLIKTVLVEFNAEFERAARYHNRASNDK
jgi:hypothetical protein